jgi:DNA polymerase-1
MGDAVDNIPGVKGFGEKTATALIQQFGSVENLLANTDQLKGKQKEKLEASKDDALLSKKLATIFVDMPFDAQLADLVVKPHNDDALKAFFTEFEFNALGRRLFGDEFKAGRGRKEPKQAASLF